MKNNIFCSVFAALLCTTKVQTSEAQVRDDKPAFTVKELVSTPAYNMNNKGDFVGGDEQGPCVLLSGKLVHLKKLPYSTVANALAVSDSGVVIGYANTANNYRSATDRANLSNHAVLWQNGQLRDLTRETNSSWGFSMAVNSQGDVVGNAGNYDVFLYKNGKTTLLSKPSAWDQLRATAVNDRDEIVGSVQHNDVHGGTNNFLWRDGKYTYLDTLDSVVRNGIVLGTPTAINNKGEIVGYTFTSQNLAGSVYLYRDGVVHDLGIQTHSVPGTAFYSAIGINDAGQIVGYVGQTPQTPSSLFFWQNGKVYDLGSLTPTLVGWTLYFRSINNRGQILVIGSKDQKSHTFLLTPVTRKP